MEIRNMIETVSANERKLVFLTEEDSPAIQKWNERRELITVGVVTYSQNFLLKTLINCFKAQTSDNWKMVIIHDGPINEELYLSLVNDGYISDERILLVTTGSRYNDYGHSLRNIIIKKHLNSDWLLLTNGDNYYVPNFVEHMETEIEKDKAISMLAFPCILQRSNRNGSDEYSENFVLEPTIRVGYIDMGQFIVRKEIAKKFNLNPTAIADGEFCVKCAALIKKEGKKVNRTYSVDFVHNN